MNHFCLFLNFSIFCWDLIRISQLDRLFLFHLHIIFIKFQYLLWKLDEIYLKIQKKWSTNRNIIASVTSRSSSIPAISIAIQLGINCIECKCCRYIAIFNTQASHSNHAKSEVGQLIVQTKYVFFTISLFECIWQQQLKKDSHSECFPLYN